MCDTSGMSILHIRTTFPAPSKVIMPEPLKELEDEESDLACIIWLCPGEFFVNAIISLKDNMTSTIQPRMLGKTTGIWTIDPCFVVAQAEQGVFHRRVIGPPDHPRGLK